MKTLVGNINVNAHHPTIIGIQKIINMQTSDIWVLSGGGGELIYTHVDVQRGRWRWGQEVRGANGLFLHVDPIIIYSNISGNQFTQFYQ